MDAVRLAHEGLALLALQAEYFRTRATENLQECKRAEARFRQMCRDVINPPAKPRAGLFDASPTQCTECKGRGQIPDPTGGKDPAYVTCYQCDGNGEAKPR